MGSINPPKTNVIALQRRQPDEDVVEYLRQLLQEAERGEVVGIIAACHYGGSDFGYTGAGSLVKNSAMGMGAAFRLAQNLLRA